MSSIKIIPFGGVRENGKNMYAVEIENQIFILDAGIKKLKSLMTFTLLMNQRQLILTMLPFLSLQPPIQFQKHWGLS